VRSGPSGGGSAVYAATTWSATWRREITADGRGRPRLPCSARQRQPAIHPERQGDRMAWTAPPAAMNRRRLSAATYYRECKGSASALAPLSLRAALGLGADRYRGVARIEERARPRAELGSRAVARHEALAAVRQQLRPHWEGAQSTRSTPGGCAAYPEEYPGRVRNAKWQLRCCAPMPQRSMQIQGHLVRVCRSAVHRVPHGMPCVSGGCRAWRGALTRLRPRCQRSRPHARSHHECAAGPRAARLDAGTPSPGRRGRGGGQV
jgi:hypothetical protein